jgi:hypothetical protein
MLLLLVAMLLAPALASAAYNCSITSPGFATAYSPTAPTDNVTPTFFTFTCTRGLGDAITMSWTAAANNGMYPRGGGRIRAAFGGNSIIFVVY